MKTILAFFIILGSLIAFPSLAQESGLPREQAEKAARYAHSEMERIRLPGGRYPSKSELEKHPYPVIPYEMSHYIIVRGILSSMADTCEMDWQGKNFDPMMIQLRQQNPGWDDIQMGYVKLLHDLIKGQKIARKNECTPEMKNNLAGKFLIP